jgi:putative oxidoreductase
MFASVPKLIAPLDFSRAVANYELLPSRLIRPVAAWLPRLELAAGLCLLVGLLLPLVAAVTAGLLLVFTVAVAINLVHGRRIECGCGGFTAPRRIGTALVLRDLMLVGAAALVALKAPGPIAVPYASLAHGSGVATSDAVAVLLVAAVAVILSSTLAEARRLSAARRSLLEGETA